MDDMQVYIANLGKYNEGELVGAWFTFPIDFEEVKEKIGLNDEYEEYAIHDYELPFTVDEYTSIGELNRLWEMVSELPEELQSELSALLTHFSSIEELSEHQEDIIIHSDCDDMYDVARYYIEETGALGEVPASLQSSIKSVGTLLLADFLFYGVAQSATPIFYERIDYMKKIRSYTSIWSVEKVLYSINDFRLPFPITFTQMTWFVVSLFAVMILQMLELANTEDGIIETHFQVGSLLKYFGIPVAFTWFMSTKTFDGKKPYGFLKSVIAYALRPKLTYAGKKVTLGRNQPQEAITAVRSEFYGISN